MNRTPNFIGLLAEFPAIALAALFAAVTLLPCAAQAKDSKTQACIHSEAHDAVTVFLIDLTASVPLGQNFDTTVSTLSGMLAPGERLLAALILDKRASTRILIDVVKPKDSMWDSKLAIKRKQKQFEECLSSLKNSSESAESGTLASQNATSKSAKQSVSAKNSVQASAILETLEFVQEILRGERSTSRRLVIYSDMIQNSDFLSFYKLGAKDTAAALLERTQKENLIPAFSGLEVFVAGAGGSQSDKQARLAEDFWSQYFSKTGAALKFYGPVLVQ